MLSWLGPPPAVMMTDRMIRPTMVMIWPNQTWYR
jgi:hypothetical protein